MAVSLLLLLASPLAVVAQASPSVVVGSTVRAKLTGPGARWVQGKLAAATSDSVAIRLQESGDTVAFARSSLAEFQVSHGTHARTGKGALLGLGIGAGAGLLLGVAVAAVYDCTASCEIDVGAEDVLALTALGGGIGAGAGALIGAASRSERWQPVGESRPTMRRGSAVPRGTLGLQIRF